MAAPRLNGPFKYRSSVNTDIRRTFERVRREQAAAAKLAQPAAPAPAPEAPHPMLAPLTVLRARSGR